MASVNLAAALNHRMNHLIARQGVISGNIANANTPKYLAKDVSFQSMVESQRGQMKATHSRHLQPATQRGNTGKVTESTTGIKHNGNSVTLDQEMLKMNETSLNYRFATQLYSKHAAMQKTALGRQ